MYNLLETYSEPCHLSKIGFLMVVYLMAKDNLRLGNFWTEVCYTNFKIWQN